MKAIMNQTQSWCCDKCDKTIQKKVNQNFSIPKHINTKKNIVVKEDEFFEPETDGVNFFLNDTIKDCRKENNLIPLIVDVHMTINI